MDKQTFFNQIRTNPSDLKSDAIQFAIDNNLINFISPTMFNYLNILDNHTILKQLLKYPFIFGQLSHQILKSNLDTLINKYLQEKEFDIVIALINIKRNDKYLKILLSIKDEPSISNEYKIMLNQLLQAEKLIIIDHKKEDYQAIFNSIISTPYTAKFPDPFFDESIFTEENNSLMAAKMNSSNSNGVIEFIKQYLKVHKQIPDHLKKIIESKKVIINLNENKIPGNLDKILEILPLFFYIKQNEPNYKEIQYNISSLIVNRINNELKDLIKNEKINYNLINDIEYKFNKLYQPILCNSETIKTIFFNTIESLESFLSIYTDHDKVIDNSINKMIKFFKSAKISRKLFEGSKLIKKPENIQEISILLFGEKAKGVNESYELLFNGNKDSDYLTSNYISLLKEIDTKTELKLNDFELEF